LQRHRRRRRWHPAGLQPADRQRAALDRGRVRAAQGPHLPPGATAAAGDEDHHSADLRRAEQKNKWRGQETEIVWTDEQAKAYYSLAAKLWGRGHSKYQARSLQTFREQFIQPFLRGVE